MAYSVNWLTSVVSVPKSDLTLISGSPEVYELDANAFWAAIHDIQDGEGITYPDIMRSNAPTVLSGQTYVRSVEVINGYRIEFEDGQYQVNLVGANNNLVDVRVPNQVSLVGNNSAGAVVVSSGSGLDDGQAETLSRLLKIMEGDEEFTINKAYVRDKDTKEVLVEKDIAVGTGVPVHLREPTS